MSKQGAKLTDYERLPDEAFSVYDHDRAKEVDELIGCLEVVEPFEQGTRVLEIGCGTGSLLNEFRNRGAIISGFEPSPVAVARARDLYNIDSVINSVFLPSPVRVPRQIFLLSDVIEHLDNCVPLFKSIRGSMAESAVLLVKTGDCASINAQLFLPRWSYVLIEQHVTFYNEHALRALCDRTGFKIAALRRHVNPLGGSALWDATKNVAKTVLLRLSSAQGANRRRFQINLAYDHLIAALVPRND
jgi:predicted TPR repeat methyltransferase